MTDADDLRDLQTLLDLMRQHGARGEPVRQFIRATLRVRPSFEPIAAALLLLYEHKDQLLGDSEAGPVAPS